MAGMPNGATGFDYAFKELEECGRRVWHTQSGLSNLMGVTAADDRLPKQIVTAHTDGGAGGSVPGLDIMLREFCPVRGLGPDGRPSKGTLNRLELSDLAARLYA